MDFEQMLNDSLTKRDRKLSVGDKVSCEILSVGKEQVVVSTGTRYDGFVPANLMQDGSGQARYKSGDVVDLYVTFIKGSQIYLSPQASGSALAEGIQEAFDNNQAIEGRVESINKGGFQVNILGKAAFCPLSQMDIRRIEKPEEYVGKKFEFKITQLGEGGRNVVISRRKLLEESQGQVMANFQSQRKPGDVVTGKVTRLEPFGAFIEIAPGVEGLAHISELSWTRVSSPKDVVEPGQVVSAKILRIENDGRLKISLTLKQSENDPWQNLPAQVQTGRVVTGKVTRCMPFGAFVELAPGVEGLVPLSELSTKRVAAATEVVKEGEQVSVMVKEINPQSKRISLSIKEAEGEAASQSEAEDIKAYAATQAARASKNSFSLLGAKMQAALDKKQKP
ncbi:MAG TPA: S1 RNA-binding domain-containing protein [Bdellovibrionota bacterium]|nr:S1 RNA-binding domain-containing protein [Bdellovibrionota bacterium]